MKREDEGAPTPTIPSKVLNNCPPGNIRTSGIYPTITIYKFTNGKGYGVICDYRHQSPDGAQVCTFNRNSPRYCFVKQLQHLTAPHFAVCPLLNAIANSRRKVRALRAKKLEART
ncbi:MAG: hypothetical protein ACXQS4_03845 [Methermicoccaceae archaeon]